MEPAAGQGDFDLREGLEPRVLQTFRAFRGEHEAGAVGQHDDNLPTLAVVPGLDGTGNLLVCHATTRRRQFVFLTCHHVFRSTGRKARPYACPARRLSQSARVAENRSSPVVRRARRDERKSGVWGTSVAVRVALVGRRILKKKISVRTHNDTTT